MTYMPSSLEPTLSEPLELFITSTVTILYRGYISFLNFCSVNISWMHVSIENFTQPGFY